MGQFITPRGMSEIKHDIEVRNSYVKRGEYKRSNHTQIVQCGCGNDGCTLEIDMTPPEKKK